MDHAYSIERKTKVAYIDEVPDSINVARMTEKQFHAKVQRGYADVMEGRTYHAQEVFEKFLQTH